jgi:hypothetical protein
MREWQALVVMLGEWDETAAKVSLTLAAANRSAEPI